MAEPPGAALSLVRLALLFYGAMLALAVVWSAITGDSLFYASEAAQLRGVAPLRDVGLGVLAAAATVFTSQVITLRTRWGQDLARGLAELVGRRSVLECLVLAGASGFAEEALFRGLLQPAVGWVGASLLFGLAHFAPRRELLPWTGFAVLAGFLLGGLFEWTGNLAAPVVAHVGINAINLRLLSLRCA